MAAEYLDRPPRIQPELPIAEIEIPNPPERNQGGEQPLIALLVPLITILGFVFVAGSGNVLFILPMGLAMILSIGLTVQSNRKARKEFEAKEKAYAVMLAEMRQEMTRAHNTQRIFYRYNYPDIPTVLKIASRAEASRFGPRLWERRSTDSDFCTIRLGIGSRPSSVIYKVGTGNDPISESSLWKDARKLAADSQIITDVPITIQLRTSTKEREDSNGSSAPGNRPAEPATNTARHSIGVFGRNPSNTADFARGLLTHFSAFHSATDTRLYVVGLPGTSPGWQWAEWLPHCNTRTLAEEAVGPDRPNQFDQLCFSPEKEKVSEFWKRIERELDSRQVRMREMDEEDNNNKRGSDNTLPFLLVVVDLLGEVPQDSPLKDVASEAVVATINQLGPQLGAAIIYLATDPSKIPSECVAMIEVASIGEKVIFRYTQVGLNTPRYIGDADVINAIDARQQFASKIRRLEIRRSFGADLPQSVTLLEMHSLLESRKIDTADKLNIQENWDRSLQVQNQEWLNVPIGPVSSREIRRLFFSAKEGGDGVHGMIAGTTGSGKSELLLTLIAGLAIKYDPRIVNFVLVDYKGGAAFEPFKRLPHCVDILTNLNANAVERMFVAIQAVMDERAALLAQSGAKDLVDYRKKVVPRLRPDDRLPRTFPHLFIIVDEFAETAAAEIQDKDVQVGRGMDCRQRDQQRLYERGLAAPRRSKDHERIGAQVNRQNALFSQVRVIHQANTGAQVKP